MRAAFRMLEEERRPAGLDDAVDDLGRLEVRVDLGLDADELALALEQGDPLAEVVDDHRRLVLAAGATAARHGGGLPSASARRARSLRGR